METLVTLFLAVLGFSWAVQALLVAGFVWRLRNFQRPLVSDAECPSAAVVLCLRGGDPFLGLCLERLFQQDYPNYRVLIVLDHPTDPAHEVLAQVLPKPRACSVELLSLDTSLDRCSLKCASLVQALKQLGDSVQIVAQVDADTITHPTWLRELASGLAPADVGAATGNRWYMPHELSLGAAVRYLWNAAAVVQMDWYRIAWGGSLAFKLEAIRQAELIDKWQHALCEDTMSFRQLAMAGYRVVFVPNLMMINRENCSLRNFYAWVQRQLLTVRLYHPAWYAVVGHGISSATLLVIGWGWCVWALLQGQIASGIMLLLGMWGFAVALLLLILPIESAVRRIGEARGEQVRWISRPRPLFWMAMLCATQSVYSAALLACMSLRYVHWRGIDYRVSGPWQIQRLNYAPYRDMPRMETGDHTNRESL